MKVQKINDDEFDLRINREELAAIFSGLESDVDCLSYLVKGPNQPHVLEKREAKLKVGKGLCNSLRPFAGELWRVYD
jgi:hypothetical protein